MGMAAHDCWTSRDGLGFHHRIVLHPEPAFPPTLFVSGAFQTMESWARFARSFAPHTTVVLADPPGIGRSDLLPAGYGIDFLAACLEQVLDEHGIERATLVAASYGTPSAYRLAQRCPDRIERVVLAGTMKEMPPHQRDPVAATLVPALAGNRRELADLVVAGLLCQDPRREIEGRELAARVLRGGILRMSDHDLLKYVANTRRLLEHAPLDVATRIVGPEALVFSGEHDVFTTPAACLEIARAFERAWFTTVQRADHLFHLERFDVVIALLLAFFEGRLPDAVPPGCAAPERIEPRAAPVAA